MRTRVLLSFAIAAAAAIGPHRTSVSLGLMAFGLFNALVVVPGTTWVRMIAVATAVWGLIAPGRVEILVLGIVWLIWPPAYLLAWSVASEPDTPANERQGYEGLTPARLTLAAIIIAIAIGTVAYRVIFGYGLQQTAALFVGIPTLLALTVIFAVSPLSATGLACKAVTLGLLVSLVFLGEGMLCVAMSAPLFYVVAIALGKAVDNARRGTGLMSKTMSCVAVLAFVPMSFEGVTESTSFVREETVVVSQIVTASAQEIERAVLATPRFDRGLPAYLRAGFPRPTSTRIERTSSSSRWIVRMRGGEMRLDGMEPRAGDLVLQLEESNPGIIRWRAVADDSHMTHFLAWREATLQWEQVGPSQSKVTCTLRYDRRLDPAWYFGPWQRYAVRLSAGYLIDTVATP